MAYRTHLATSAAAAPPDVLADLRDVDRAVWAEVLLRGFAVAPRPLDPSKARDFAGRVAAAAASADGALGDALSAKLAALPAEPDATKRAQAVLAVVQRAMADVQVDLSADLGYAGDDGYVQLQAALVDHMGDPVVAHERTGDAVWRVEAGRCVRWRFLVSVAVTTRSQRQLLFVLAAVLVGVLLQLQ